LGRHLPQDQQVGERVHANVAFGQVLLKSVEALVDPEPQLLLPGFDVARRLPHPHRDGLPVDLKSAVQLLALLQLVRVVNVLSDKLDLIKTKCEKLVKLL
jgi:hypothetical protein